MFESVTAQRPSTCASIQASRPKGRRVYIFELTQISILHAAHPRSDAFRTLKTGSLKHCRPNRESTTHGLPTCYLASIRSLSPIQRLQTVREAVISYGRQDVALRQVVHEAANNLSRDYTGGLAA